MKDKIINKFKCVFPAKSINEGFARSVMAAFVSQLDPRAGDVADIKTAVSEAVTNCIVHAYRDSTLPSVERTVELRGEYYSDGKIVMIIKDKGNGIPDIKRAMEPLFTTDPDGERSGMGFTVMESFCDRVKVTSHVGRGTVVRLIKTV